MQRPGYSWPAQQPRDGCIRCSLVATPHCAQIQRRWRRSAWLASAAAIGGSAACPAQRQSLDAMSRMAWTCIQRCSATTCSTAARRAPRSGARRPRMTSSACAVSHPCQSCSSTICVESWLEVAVVMPGSIRSCDHESHCRGRDSAALSRSHFKMHLLQLSVVYKFGGSSVATAERMREVASIICSFPDQAPAVVLSAMGKVRAKSAVAHLLMCCSSPATDVARMIWMSCRHERDGNRQHTSQECSGRGLTRLAKLADALVCRCVCRRQTCCCKRGRRRCIQIQTRSLSWRPSGETVNTK